MSWFTKKTSGNEFGEYLPDYEAQLQEENIRIRANNQREAEKECEKTAQEYNGIDPEVTPKGEKEFNCKFKFWS